LSRLEPDIITYFMDVNMVESRLRKLAAQDSDSELKRSAVDLLNGWTGKIRVAMDERGKSIPS
jgi:hypothetical protein